MKYICQLDYPYVRYVHNTSVEDDDKRHNGTFAKSACGLASAMMVVDRLLCDTELTIAEALQLSYDSNANYKVGTSMSRLAPALASKFGFRHKATNDVAEVRACVQTGGCVIANSGGDREGYIGVFTHGGHYIVVTEYTEDGKYVVLDPAQAPGKFQEEGRIGKVEVVGHYIYTPEEVLVKDCENRDPAFHLFWRR